MKPAPVGRELRDMKMQPSLERALSHPDILVVCLSYRFALRNYLKNLTHKIIECFLRRLVWLLQRDEEEPHEEARDLRHDLGGT